MSRFSFALLLCLASCSSKSETATPTDAGVDAPANDGPAIARFVVPAKLEDLDGEHWFDHPWPSDLRREGNAIRLDGWPNPRGAVLISSYLKQLRGKIDGFSPMAAGYVTFEGPLDESSLPADALASTKEGSSLQIIEVETGARTPVIWKFRDRVGDYYMVPNTLSFSPALGHVLKPHTKYAAVVTRAAKGRDGKPAAPNAALSDVLAGKGTLGTAWAPSIAKLGVKADQIAHLTIFTTSDPTAESLKAAEDARSLPPPKVTMLAADGSAAEYDRYTGSYSGSPDYQLGVPPFLISGGGFSLDASGKPQKQRDFDLRFKLAVPKADKCPMPAKGYPIVLYAHGTGGDWTSFLGDGTATALAQKCLASMGVDQIFHGTRPGAPALTDPDRDSKIALAFFNLSNADAARTNTRQSGIDEIARAHLIKSGGLVVSAAVSATKADITFDPDRIAFFGHSQGGLNGPMLLATDDRAKGGVLSGAGSAISYSLLMKVKPDPCVSCLVKAFLQVSAENEDELGPLHPALSLVQTVVDPADPVHYYGALARSPFAGLSPKSIYMTEGIAADGTGDNYAPPRTIEAGAIAGGFPLLSPVVFDVPEITKLDGVAPVMGPLKGNAAGGKATVALAQFTPPAGVDGHFVVFDVPKAKATAASFCQSLLTEDVPTITP
jgi:predicted esterase